MADINTQSNGSKGNANAGRSSASGSSSTSGSSRATQANVGGGAGSSTGTTSGSYGSNSGENLGFSKSSHAAQTGADSMASAIGDRTAMIRDFAGDMFSRVKDSDAVASYDRSVRANPYLHIGLAGAGALLIGVILGRAFSGGRSSVGTVRGMGERAAQGRGYAFEAGYDE